MGIRITMHQAILKVASKDDAKTDSSVTIPGIDVSNVNVAGSEYVGNQSWRIDFAVIEHVDD